MRCSRKPPWPTRRLSRRGGAAAGGSHAYFSRANASLAALKFGSIFDAVSYA